MIVAIVLFAFGVFGILASTSTLQRVLGFGLLGFGLRLTVVQVPLDPRDKISVGVACLVSFHALASMMLAWRLRANMQGEQNDEFEKTVHLKG